MRVYRFINGKEVKKEELNGTVIKDKRVYDMLKEAIFRINGDSK